MLWPIIMPDMPIIKSGKDLIYRAIQDFLKQHPQWPFMPVATLAEQMKVSEDVVIPVLENLHELGLIEFHPMWPTMREFFVSNKLAPPERETP